MSIYNTFIYSMEEKLYNINKTLIKDICNELNKSDKIDYLINKYLHKETKLNKKNNMLNDFNVKKHKSSYLFFTEEVRPKLHIKFPNDTVSQISKRLYKVWNNLTPKDKNKYEKKASLDKDKNLYEINKTLSHSSHSSSKELVAEEKCDDNDISNDNDISDGNDISNDDDISDISDDDDISDDSD